jgi:hypothetical protein
MRTFLLPGRHSRRHVAALLLLAGAAMMAFSTYAEETSSAITFLHLRLNADSISLVDARVVPGTLKIPRGGSPPGELIYEVVSDSSTVLYTHGMADPLVRKYEYEDPDHEGRLKSKVVRLDETEFTIRVPYDSQASRVDFYRIEQTGGTTAQPATRRLIGTIQLEDVRGAQR